MSKTRFLQAFTLVEILIIVALIAILSVSVISAINPREQRYKSNDVKVKNLISEIFKAHLRYAQFEKGTYLDSPAVSLQINSPNAIAFLETLISAQELKNSILSDKNLDKILLTTDSIDNVALCFLPEAKSNQIYSENTRYDKEGFYRQDCDDYLCYYCLVTDTDSKDYEARITIYPTATPDPCSNYNIARPNFPYTTDFADKHTKLGCTNFNIRDRGCDKYCPSGQRHLIKFYNSVNLDPRCTPDLKEDYCVPEPYANCLHHSQISGDNEFKWGCTNPQRPYSWK